MPRILHLIQTKENLVQAKENLIKAKEDIIQTKETHIQKLDTQVAELIEKVSLLEILHFGTRSEKWTKEDDRQALLFNEAEDAAFRQQDEEKQKAVLETIEIGPYKKRKPGKQGRKPISKELPREIREYDISEKEKTCACGCLKTCIGEDITERAAIKPAEVKVIREIKKKYACRKCEGTEADEPGVVTAKGEKHLIPGSIADESLLAWSVVEKYEFALPLYRQAKRLEYIGIPIPRATLSNLVIRTAEECEKIYELLKEHIRSGEVVNADETRVQVLREKGRKPQSLSWMWVFTGGPPGKPSVVFHYDEKRSSEVPCSFFQNFDGWIQTDDFGAYQAALKRLNGNIIQVLCWAHARRKFYDCWKLTKSGHAKKAIDFIKKFFELEDLRNNYSLKGFSKHRKNRAQIIFDEFKSWLEKLFTSTPPKSSLGKAVSYTLDNWEQLILYIENPLLTPSNNIAENAIRPFVIGRKNWLFSCSPKGAKASAILYSLVESAKMNNLRPYDYLYYIFKQLPHVESKEDLMGLMPFNITPEKIKGGEN